RHDMIWGEPHGPPADWRAGAPIGNGDFGAMIYGYPDSMSFVLGKTDVWNRCNDDQSRFPGPSYAEFRKTFFDGDQARFQRIQDESKASFPSQEPHLTTCGRLRLHLDETSDVSRGTLRTHLKDGLVSLSWAPECFGSLPGCKATGLISREFDVMGVMIERPRGDGRQEPIRWELSRGRLRDNPPPACQTEENACFLTQGFTAGGFYTIGMMALYGRWIAEGCLGSLAGVLTPNAEGDCSLLLTIVSSTDASDTVAEARRRLHAAKEAGQERILEAHRRWWEEYWLRGLASVGDLAVERWYYTSLYICGSTLRPAKQSPGTQGIWVGENFPPWSADFHTNINIQCLYWGLLTNNRLDLMEPYLRHYRDTADVARRDAREYFGMRGLRFPHGGSIGGHEITNPAWGVLGTDPCGSSWVTQLFWQYYEYTQDREFLREVAYPLLRDVAVFYAEFLVWDEQRKGWIIAPSAHFEAKCPTFEAWGKNSLYAQAMFRGASQRAIAAAQTLGVDREHVSLWQDRLEKLSPLPCTPEGYWKAWEDHKPCYSGHNFLMPLVFPAELVSQFHGPKEWQDQARKTWQHLRELKERSCTGGAWCGGQGVCEVIRIGDREWALRAARFPEKPDPWGTNGLTRHWNWGIAQNEHAAGMCRVLADMLLLSLDGIIHLFAGIPDEVAARFHSLRAPGAFLVSAEKRGPQPDYVLVRSLAGGDLRIENPWIGCAVAVSSPPEAESGQLIDANMIELVTQPGTDYLLMPKGLNLTDVPMTDFALATSPDSTPTLGCTKPAVSAQ
ncbi:MAG: glycoside hydrolase N-terminal domain-containing protein, partial [Acidobacteria bacterium]|nr:glycoside hydrolase N-terminal domain-containing protein [Acidobacteriota bacterium]